MTIKDKKDVLRLLVSMDKCIHAIVDKINDAERLQLATAIEYAIKDLRNKIFETYKH